MNKIRTNYQDRLFFITILFFVIGMINISLAVLGLVCFVLPFVLYWTSGEKLWCKYYCPRAGVFSRLVSRVSIGLKMPKFLYGTRAKNAVMVYFVINILIIIMTTIAVARDQIISLDHLRFLLAFRLPFDLPQLVSIPMPEWIIHLGYRVYSMMLTSTIVGVLMGIVYRPRAWCAICPVQTLTTQRKATD